jgi:hypothetical protein
MMNVPVSAPEASIEHVEEVKMFEGLEVKRQDPEFASAP